MKKSTVNNSIIFVIALCIYNVIIFAIPFEHTEVFWASYIFAMIAMVSQIGVSALAFCGTQSTREKLYAYPIQSMGLKYVAVQLAISLIFAITTFFTEDIPAWAVYVIGVVVLGVFAVLVLFADTARNTIVEFEQQAQQQTVQMKTFRVNVDSVLRRVEDPELKKVVNKLSETAKYSDPVSVEALYPVEAEITRKINELYDAVERNDIVSAKGLAVEAIRLFEDRNAQCKMYKKG